MEKYLGEVHNLKLIRNNNLAQGCSIALDSQDNHKNIFFMLDYFDFMEQSELFEEQQGYIAFSDMIQDQNHKSELGISKKVMGLYQMKNKKKEKNSKTVFSMPEKQTVTLSSQPFLGIIQIFICDYQFACELNKIDEVENVLLSYENKITEIVEKKINREKEDKAATFSLYRSIASADFCLVIRSSCLLQIYEIVSEILNLNETAKKNDVERVRMFNTYTNIGIECVKHDGKYLTFSEEVLEKNRNTKFAIRFSFNDDFNKQISELKKVCDDIDVVNGLFGRYDAVVRISMEKFSKLYPYLCMNKLGLRFKESEKEEVKSLFVNEQIVRQLVQGIVNGKLRAINERALLGIGECEFNSDEQYACINNCQISFVRQKNKEIREQYKQIGQKYKENFLSCKNRFLNIYNLLGKVIEAYETLGYEQDTHINWYICMGYFQEFFKKTENFLEAMEDDDAEREKILRELQGYVKAMNEYTRLLQAVNQHTIQSPQYDVVAPMDAEKFLIAYSEYMYFLDKMHYSYAWKKMENVCNENRKKCSVVIYPEMTKGKLELTEVIARDNVFHQDQDREASSLLICTIPSFEYFERPYDMIPLISHEMFHQVLILDRKTRNCFMIKRLMEAAFKHFCFKMNMKALGENLYVNYRYLTDLFVEEFKDVFLRKYKEENEHWSQYLMTHIGISILNFLQKLLGQEETGDELFKDYFYSSDYYNHELIGLDGKKDACIFLMNAAETEYDSETETRKIEKVVNLLNTLDRLSEGKEKEKLIKQCRLESEHIFSDLLEKYSNGIEPEYQISYQDIKNISDKERDNLIYQKAQCINKEDKNNVPRLKEYYEKIRMLHRNICTLQDYLRFCYENDYKYTEELCEVIGNVKKKIEEKYENQETSEYFIYGQEEAAILKYWNVFLKSPKAAAEQIRIFLYREDLREYKKIMEHEVTVYRETCADIFMCRYMKMSSFGYLRMAVSIWGRMGGYEEEMYSGLSMADRMKNVLGLLLVNEMTEDNKKVEKEWIGKEYILIPISPLYNKIQKYINCSIGHIRKRMENLLKKKYSGNNAILEQMNDYMDRMEEAMNYMFECVKRNSKPFVEGSPLEEIFMKNETQFTRASKLKRCLQGEINSFFRIVYILRAVSECQRDGNLIIEKEVYDHYRLVFDNPKSDNMERSDLFEEKLHDTVKKVADFYNDPESEENGETSNRDKLRQMLQFVQDYYYYNRIRKTKDEMEELRA